MSTPTRTTPFGEVEIWDAHAHFFSRAFFETLARLSPLARDADEPAARAGEVAGVDVPPADPAALGGRWVEELDRHGVSRALLMASVPGDEASIALAVAASGGRIAGAAMFDPTAEGAEARARRAFDDLGLSVLALFPAMHRYSVAESEGARAVAAVAGERTGRAVLVHCGALSVGIRGKLGLPSRFDLRHSSPLDLHLLAKEFPDTTFVVPHFGAGMFREALMVADLCPNVMLDTSSSNTWLRYEPAPLDLAGVFRRALEVVGPGRLLFGTDSSFFPRGWQAGVFDAQASALAGAGAGEETARAVFCGNLRRVLAG